MAHESSESTPKRGTVRVSEMVAWICVAIILTCAATSALILINTERYDTHRIMSNAVLHGKFFGDDRCAKCHKPETTLKKEQ